MSEVKWVPVSVVCKMLKVSRSRVHQLCSDGRLVARKMESTTLVELRSVDEWVSVQLARMVKDAGGGDMR